MAVGVYLFGKISMAHFNPAVSGVESIIELIVDYAANKDTDLIVIGTRGRTGLKRLIIGSVASGVVQHAHCPVLLVR